MKTTTVVFVALMLIASKLLAADLVELKDVSGKYTIKVKINKVVGGKVQVTDEKGKTSEYSLSIFDQKSRQLILLVTAKKPKELLKTLKGHKGPVETVAYSPDGKRIVSCSRDSTLIIWDADSGKELQILRRPAAFGTSVAFSPDGKRIVSSGRILVDYAVQIWDVNSGNALQTLKGHKDKVETVAYSPDGKRIVSCSRDGTLIIWDANSGKELQTLRGHTQGWVTSVAFSPDGKRFVSGAHDKTLRIWDADSGKVMQILKGHEIFVNSVAFSPDGKRIVSGSTDRTLRIWDANSGKVLHILKEYWTVNSVAFSPDSKWIISGIGESRGKVSGYIRGRQIKILDADSGKVLQILNAHTDRVNSVAYSPDGKRIVSGSDDETIKIWDVSK